MCEADYRPTLKNLPHPVMFSRFLLFSYFEKHSRSEEVRQSFTVKAHTELAELVRCVDIEKWYCKHNY